MTQNNNNKRTNGDHLIIKRHTKTSQSLVTSTTQAKSDSIHKKPQLANLTSMKIAHVNINGLRNKVDLLNAELVEYVYQRLN